MLKIVLGIDGMACGMCETHINNVIRKSFPVKKVASSHRKGETVIIAEHEIDEYKLREAINQTGYRVTGIKTEPYERKSFSIFKRS